MISYLLLQEDKVILYSHLSFPKVVLASHLSEDFDLPSHCPHPSHLREVDLRCLDVVRAIGVYHSTTAPVCKSDSFFIVLNGPAVHYFLVDLPNCCLGLEPLFLVTAHSTRVLSVTWAIHYSASVVQVCKVAV